MQKKLTLFLMVLALSFISLVVRAQEGGADASDLSLYVGSMLPNQINGVTEILPLFGGRYGLGTKIGTLEAGFANSHAVGVDFTVVSANLRGDIPVAEGISGSVYGGLNFSYYSPKNATVRQSDYGVNFGVAARMLVAGTLWLRTDLNFMGGPGTSLWLLFGLEFKGQ